MAALKVVRSRHGKMVFHCLVKIPKFTFLYFFYSTCNSLYFCFKKFLYVCVFIVHFLVFFVSREMIEKQLNNFFCKTCFITWLLTVWLVGKSVQQTLRFTTVHVKWILQSYQANIILQMLDLGQPLLLWFHTEMVGII